MKKPSIPLQIDAALVADDHSVTRFGLSRFLRDELHVKAILEAETFEESVEILTHHPVEIAIFDLDIPGLDSAKDLEQIRRQWPQIKVVVLSGSQRKADILAALDAGVHGYIVKTASLTSLADWLGYILAGEIYVPPCLAELAGSSTSAGTAASPPAPGRKTASLSARQLQVLRGLCEGLTNKQIGARLNLSEGTVKMHLSVVYRVLGVKTRAQATMVGRPLID